MVSHFNKATKGRIVRALLEHGADPRTPAALADTVRDLGWTVEEHEELDHDTRLVGDEDLIPPLSARR